MNGEKHEVSSGVMVLLHDGKMPEQSKARGLSSREARPTDKDSQDHNFKGLSLSILW